MSPVKNLYACLIEEQSEKQAFLQMYWARAEHIGEGIEKVINAARSNGCRNPRPCEIDPFDLNNLKTSVQPGTDAEVFWSASRHYFPAEFTFTLPYGIVGSCMDGEDDPDDIKEGFTREKDEHGKVTISVNVQRDQLLPVYERLLRALPSYRVFWYLLHDHWDDAEDRFLVNESLDTLGKILRHLREHELDSILNGYVTLTAYHNDGATNLNISDHKRIIIFTYSKEVADTCSSVLADAGISQFDNLVSIDTRIHHWHYRHPRSRTREELIQHLHSVGFKDWNPKK